MTTTVRILIEGNKNCEVSLNHINSGDFISKKIVQPHTYVTYTIWDDVAIEISEIGDFVN